MHFLTECEKKVRTLCKLLPNNEWSGAAFYTYIKENEETVILVKDFFLQDVGSQVYTEYDLNGDVAAYYADHIESLIGCKIGGLHSHNTMGTFFSGTDMATLHEVGKGMNNLLSIIVNNAGTYSAKFTQKVKVNKHQDIHTDTKETRDFVFLGDEPKSETTGYGTDSTNDSEFYEVRCWDCDIERPDCEPDVTLEEQYKKEIEEIKKKVAEKQVKVTKTTGCKVYQPSLFGGLFGNDYDIDSWHITRFRESDRMDNLFLSLINLSFSTSYYAQNTILEIETLEFPEAFIASFIEAWDCFYNPSAEEVSTIIGEVQKYVPLKGSRAQEELLTALDNELNNIAE